MWDCHTGLVGLYFLVAHTLITYTWSDSISNGPFFTTRTRPHVTSPIRLCTTAYLFCPTSPAHMHYLGLGSVDFGRAIPSCPTLTLSDKMTHKYGCHIIESILTVNKHNKGVKIYFFIYFLPLIRKSINSHIRK